MCCLSERFICVMNHILQSIVVLRLKDYRRDRVVSYDIFAFLFDFIMNGRCNSKCMRWPNQLEKLGISLVRSKSWFTMSKVSEKSITRSTVTTFLSKALVTSFEIVKNTAVALTQEPDWLSYIMSILTASASALWRNRAMTRIKWCDIRYYESWNHKNGFTIQFYIQMRL